jgi:excisionase family DNA binding protein
MQAFSRIVAFGDWTMPEPNHLEEKIDLVLERLSHLPETNSVRFLPTDAAAKYAGVSVESIRRLLAAKKLTAYRPVPGRIVVDRRQLDALILASTRQARTGRGRWNRNGEHPGG